MWDVEQDLARFEHESPWTTAVAISPDGKILATAGQNRLRFWNCATGEPVGEIDVRGWVSSLAYSPGGDLLAVGGSDGYLTVWDATTHRKVWSASLGSTWAIEMIFLLSVGAGLTLLFFAIVFSRTPVGRASRTESPKLLVGKESGFKPRRFPDDPSIGADS